MRSAANNPFESENDLLILTIIHDIRRHLRRSMIASHNLDKQTGANLAAEARTQLDEILAAGKELDHLLLRLAKYAVSGSKGSENGVGDVGIMFDNAVRRVASENIDVEMDGTDLQSCGINVPYAAETVLAELLDNCLKFRKGHVKISVLVETETEQTVIGIVDTGIGFDPRYANKIFEPFERLHPADVYPGTGLGLSICRRVVTAWGGRLWATSKAGSGSTFRFSLPSEANPPR